MDIFAQAAITGILLGGVYGLMAMGLSLGFGVMRVVNFAHGEFVLIGMYAVYFLYTSFGLNPFVGLLVVIPVGLLLGAVFQRALLQRLIGTGDLRQLLLTLGLGMIIFSLAQIVFSPSQLSLSGFIWGSELVQWGPLFIRPAHVVGFIIALAASIGLTLLLRQTDLGRRMRATVDDATMAESSGVRSKRIYIVAMALGSAMALIAGGIIMTFQPVSPNIGSQFLVLAFVAVVLGGLGNVIGAFVGGLVAGVVQQLTAQYVAVGLQDVGLFVLFIAVLIFRPYGLFGRKELAA